MSDDKQYTWIDVEGPHNVTEKARLFKTDEGDKWIPKSVTGAMKKDNAGFTIRLEVEMWWAKANNLDDGFSPDPDPFNGPEWDLPF